MAPPLHTLGISYMIFLTYIICLSVISTDIDEERKVYIVYMGSLPKSKYSPSLHHFSMLQEVVDSRYVKQSLIRSYTRSFNGFAAYLTNQEQQKLAARDDVVLVFPSRTLKLHTTASWDFLGFPLNVHRNLNVESDIIIGVIDSGIWPESKSFDDNGLGPIPKKWKGACDGGKNFTCNRKLIGARHYVIGQDSARDFEGHGSHTASTAAGKTVQNASFYGIAKGTARGGVPAARIAAYKVCSDAGCLDEAILAAFDDAIADGVDILTLSLGSSSPVDLRHDSIAIASFHAIEKGILTVNSAGNEGELPGSVTSTAPWLFTVAASTINRKIISKVELGNGRTLAGNAINSFNLNGTQFPLVYGKAASKQCEDLEAKECVGCLDRNLVQGKIVLCKFFHGSSATQEVESNGGLGTISVADEDLLDVSFVTPFASSLLSLGDFELVENYFNSTKTPKANILASEAIQDSSAPKVASFSSRGPNTIFPDILKPDITAPGVDILAAYSPAASPSNIPGIDTRSVAFNIVSGTSMSCPHVTGAAAYVKSLHPEWSPSAIKSALMTTAWEMNATSASHKDAEFSYGAGHLNPVKAADPGLLYETFEADYIKLICGLNDSSTLSKIFFHGDNSTCNRVVSIQATDLNYPTLSAKVQKLKGFRIQFKRTVTNVGLSNSTYKAIITKTSQLDVSVEPEILSFQALQETKSFVVTVKGERVQGLASASLKWFDGIHTVRSSIVLYT